MWRGVIFPALLALCRVSTVQSAVARNSIPFDPFRLECPFYHGIVKLVLQRVESSENIRTDTMVTSFCENVKKLYPSPRDAVLTPDDEICRWTKPFKIPGAEFDVSSTCLSKEFLSGVSRQALGEFGFLCCALKDRKKSQCTNLEFDLPSAEIPQTEAGHGKRLITGIGFSNGRMIAEVCDMSIMTKAEIDAEVFANAQAELLNLNSKKESNNLKTQGGGRVKLIQGAEIGPPGLLPPGVSSLEQSGRSQKSQTTQKPNRKPAAAAGNDNDYDSGTGTGAETETELFGSPFDTEPVRILGRRPTRPPPHKAPAPPPSPPEDDSEYEETEGEEETTEESAEPTVTEQSPGSSVEYEYEYEYETETEQPTTVARTRPPTTTRPPTKRPAKPARRPEDQFANAGASSVFKFDGQLPDPALFQILGVPKPAPAAPAPAAAAKKPSTAPVLRPNSHFIQPESGSLDPNQKPGRTSAPGKSSSSNKATTPEIQLPPLNGFPTPQSPIGAVGAENTGQVISPRNHTGNSAVAPARPLLTLPTTRKPSTAAKPTVPTTVAATIPPTTRAPARVECDTAHAIRDPSSNLVVACGQGNDIWSPARCSADSFCLLAKDSNFRVCCPIRSG